MNSCLKSCSIHMVCADHVCREEDMSNSMDPLSSDHPASTSAAAPHISPHVSPHKPLAQGRTSSAWMVHAETQTCNPPYNPPWADEHFALLELTSSGNNAQQNMQPQQAQHAPQEQHAQQEQGPALSSNTGQRSWCKVCIHAMPF